ncbi:fumarylacetoacetate hydrolase family protein [Bacillus sp. JCM 19041]|uniref:2-keto-4-pentenoate hydratase n=1 Tax=Bacillus sp. JCM 19041 TaxID=1460637 RepID=UPI0006D17213
MSNQATIEQAYAELTHAYHKHESIAPLTETFTTLDVAMAYDVQMKFINKKVNDGERVVGKKIGLTSFAMQKLLGVDEPDYGHLLSQMEVKEGEAIEREALFQPKIEGEIAFVLKQELKGPNVTVEDVLAATDYIVPALEIVDSRIKDWKIKLPDTIADNASCGLFVLGNQKVNPTLIDMPSIAMKLYQNKQLINEGTGADVLGHPGKCVAWLANQLAQYDVTLRAGEVILSGALSAAVEVKSGDQITCEFTELGQVSTTFK